MRPPYLLEQLRTAVKAILMKRQDSSSDYSEDYKEGLLAAVLIIDEHIPELNNEQSNS